VRLPRLFGSRASAVEVVETRSIDSVPWDAGGPVSGSAVISESRARRLAPVFAAHRFLMDGIGTLPIAAYRRLGSERQPMGSLPALLDFLEEDGTLVDWVTKAIGSMAARGEAIGLILARDGFGFPTRVEWRPPSEFYVDDEDGTSQSVNPQWYWNGRPIARSELVHIPWLTVPGRTRGLSPIEAFAMSVQGGLSAQQYGNDWYAAGGVPPGTFKNNAIKVDQAQADVIKARLVSAIRTRQPIVYGADWDYNAITIPPQAAQFVESQKLTANMLAAIYGVPPEEIGGEPANSLTYANEEARQTARARALRPWAVRFETGVSAVLPQRQYVKVNLDAVVRADLKSRWQVHAIRRQIGAASIDEIRRYEDEPPLPDGQGASYEPLKGAVGSASEPADSDGNPVLAGRRLPELTWTYPE
jgi:HK97 family phage portal protein